MTINLEYNNQTYQINLNDGVSISIPVQFNKNEHPKFYDESDPEKQYYQSDGVKYDVNQDAGCSVPLIKMNIHCSGTHTETAAHVFKDSHLISDIANLNFIPTTLVTITPEVNMNEKYHVPVDANDKMITKKILAKHIDENTLFTDCMIIRTLPNNEDKKNKNYNKNYHPFFSNDAIHFLKENGVRHIVVDTPSIDRFDDGGQLANHKIFFMDQDSTINKNTITELAFIPDKCTDGKYFICIGTPNFKLDAAPSNPIIYKIK